jgi:DnaJ-class molecular chaperone
MARDFYDVLGVAKKATPDEIKTAYRKLARQYHPDRNPGDKQAESRFKEVQEAYDVLSDQTKRSQYDRFGTVGPDGGFAGQRGGPGGATFHWGTGQQVDPNEIFEHLFGGGGLGGMGGVGGAGGFEEALRGTRGGRRRRREPEEVESEISIPFLTAALGGSLGIKVDDQEINVKIPAGVSDGQTLRLQGAAPGGGNLRLLLRVEPHPYFRREGKDIILQMPLSLAEATLGAKVDVPTLDGSRLTVKVPPGASTGTRLRLKGKGIDGGDQYIEVQVMVPAVKDEQGRKLVEELTKLYPQNPRSGPPWS